MNDMICLCLQFYKGVCRIFTYILQPSLFSLWFSWEVKTKTHEYMLVHRRLVTLVVRLRIHGPIKTTPEFDAGGLRVKVGLPWGEDFLRSTWKNVWKTMAMGEMDEHFTTFVGFKIQEQILQKSWAWWCFIFCRPLMSGGWKVMHPNCQERSFAGAEYVAHLRIYRRKGRLILTTMVATWDAATLDSQVNLSWFDGGSMMWRFKENEIHDISKWLVTWSIWLFVFASPLFSLFFLTPQHRFIDSA